MNVFEYNANPGKVIFGSGSIKKLPDKIRRLKLSAPLLLTAPQQASLIDLSEGVLSFSSPSIKRDGTFTQTTMHTSYQITLSYLQAITTDCVISIGGSSITCLVKAISFNTDLPHLSIPTTYAGSEMTPTLGETKDGHKTTKR